MSRVNYRELKRQSKQARIFVKESIYNPLDSASNVNIPTDHKDTFATIQSLGRKEFYTYGYIAHTNTTEKPWELENKKKAMVIAGLAQKCRRESRNEAGWRSEVEFKLFERFNFEVAW